MVTRSNKLNKGHLCLKWHSATKAQSAQELVKRIDPGYGWKIEVVRDATANSPPSSPTPEKIEEADLLNTLDWLVAPYKDDNHFKQDWFMGIYMQLMTNHCPEWVDNVPTCATNFASMEFPIFARDTEDMEASAAGPDIQLAQSWESPSTINSKATWDSQSQEHPRFAKIHPNKGLEKILFQQSDAKTTQESSTWADAKMQKSSNTSLSWNSPPFDTDAPSSPATTTTDQLWSAKGAVVTAEKKKRSTTKPHSLDHRVSLTTNFKRKLTSGSEQTNTNDSKTDKTKSTSISSNAIQDTKDRNDNNIKNYITAYVKKQRFRQMKFPITPEQAFVLLFLYNDYKLWLNTINGTRIRKKFTDSKSGIKEGWSEEGQDLYGYIELLKTYQQQTGYDIQRRQREEDKTNENKRKQKHDMMDTLDKDDEDYKYYLAIRDKF
eukprot:jgi/Psemu1/27558/gm1.27558_g